MKKVVEDKALLSSSFSGLVWSDYIDFQIIHFTRQKEEGVFVIRRRLITQ
jgi:hypothetical protein